MAERVEVVERRRREGGREGELGLGPRLRRLSLGNLTRQTWAKRCSDTEQEMAVHSGSHLPERFQYLSVNSTLVVMSAL